MPAIGETAPDFELLNQDSLPTRLKKYRGRKVIIFAFPQAYTAGCTEQACGFRDQFPQIEAENAVILGISPDKPDTLKRWKIENNLQYDLLSDPTHQTLQEWGAWGKPILGLIKLRRVNRSFWVINEEGVVIDEQRGISPTQSVERALKAL
ncbi:MAG: redoxin domain-containing protein [Anaerolineaceae bacterium]|nr:redoxin domain-containing protein [Anaerolineaceae bacterium]